MSDTSTVEAEATTGVAFTYADTSRLLPVGDGARLALVANARRDPVRLDGVVRDPLRFREAMATLYAVVGSDYRYKPKDRTAYLAYQRMRREAAALSVRQAQQAHFDWLLRNAPDLTLILDPVVSVHPDRVSFEVFSKDEGTYAHLAFDLEAFDLAFQPACGTTNIDFSQPLAASLEQMRGYRTTRLTIAADAVGVATAGTGGVLEKKVRVPDSWLRGFLQVQSAAALPHDTFRLAPVDLYNALRHLRMHGDRKGKRRGLRIELVPAEPPRLVLEPWETVLPATAGHYTGRASRVLRLWGRRRLMLVKRFLPFVESVDVHVLGSGLPSFWVLRAGPAALTLGVTGFTAANWSQAVSFDLLLPRKTDADGKALNAVLKHLQQVWVASALDIGGATKLKGPALVEALQAGCQQGRVMYDVAADVYRLRPLTDGPLDLGRLQYRNDREKVAHDLVARRGAVEVVGEHRLPGTGNEITGKVAVSEDRREYRPQMLVTDEGQVGKAECTCTLFRTQGLKAGPCAHLIALRLAFAKLEAERAAGAGGPALTETRSYSRRDPAGEDVVQVTLDKARMKVRWGRAGGTLRRQVLCFGSADEARAAYLSRLGELDRKGFLDATAAG
jgi:predicted DNA-binding WGR domain protein